MLLFPNSWGVFLPFPERLDHSPDFGNLKVSWLRTHLISLTRETPRLRDQKKTLAAVSLAETGSWTSGCDLGKELLGVRS